MQTQKNSPRLFRLLAILSITVLFFSQFSGVAQAQNSNPKNREKASLAQLNLDEVQNYYGGFGNMNGPVGVVVELQDTPAALVYAEVQTESRARAAALASNQIDLISQRQATFTTSLRKSGVQATELFRTQKAYNGIWMRVDAKDLKKLLSISGVKAIHPIIAKTIDHTTSVPLIGAPQVWGGLAGLLGENITVGIIDTGVDYIHTNFGGPGTPGYATQDFTTLGEAGNLFPTTKVVGGWDFAGDAYDANDPLSIPVPDPDPMDCNGHGSHVAGSAAGLGVLTDGSTFVESVGDTYADLEALTSDQYISKFRIGPGVAPKADLYALRVFGCAGSTNLTELAIDWAMDPNGDSDLSDHLDVINMSLGASYGSENDTSAVAANNAALAGVLVAISAGNSGDVYYVTGSPGVARYAITVANSVDSGAVVGAFEVTAAPAMALTTYPATEADFGPVLDSTGVTGNVVLAVDGTGPVNDGCSALTNGAAVLGNIALIDRGTCSFKTKVANAQVAGATGVLIANNAVGFPITMGDDPTIATSITIPSMMTTQSVGTSIKADLLTGTVTVKLTSLYRDQFTMSDPAVADTVVSSSSRGPSRVGTMLKPDIAAPGDTIYSTATGTGDQGVSFGGTSMASPHVAGILALLRQQHPTWTVAELKALAMNTATNDLYTSAAHTLTYTPTRVGTGRASVANAIQSDVVAYNATDPGQVNVSYGFVDVVDTLLGIDQTIVKSITLSNKGGVDELYNVTFDSRYISVPNPGLAFTLLDASNAPLANPVTVPANSTLEIKVQVDIDAATLTRARDATILTGRERFSEGGGYVVLTSTGASPALRVPVHIAARPASDMSVAETGITLPVAASGTFSLTPSGTPVDTTDDGSLVYISELKGVSPNDVTSTGSDDAADLKYVGVISDYTSTVVGKAAFFSIATYGDWDTLNATEFDIYIDIDEDGVEDYVVFNTNTGSSTSPTDTMVSVICSLSGAGCFIEDYVNWFGGATNTNAFNNNVMTMDVYLEDFGLADGVNTDFDFYIVTFNRDASGVVDISDLMHYDVANQSFTTSAIFGEPIWDDNILYSPALDINYDKTNIAANRTTGLLLLHTHNAVNTAEVLLLTAPVAVNDSYSMKMSATLTGNVMSNDFDAELDPMTAVLVSGPSQSSSFALNTDGSFSYTPVNGFMGVDTFTYKVNDGTADSDIATVTISITPIVVSIRSTNTYDGWTLESSQTSNVGGSMSPAELRVGDAASNGQYRSIVSFNTSSIPNTAVIVGANLRVKTTGFTGPVDPFTTHSRLIADMNSGFFSGAAALQTSDFQSLATKNNIGQFKPMGVTGWYRLIFAKTFYNLITPSINDSYQFRLRYVTPDNGDGIANYTSFNSGIVNRTNNPLLSISYYIPHP